MEPPILEALRNVSHAGAWRELAGFYRGGRASRFRIFLDDACALPADWRSDWDAPTQWGSLGNSNWANKYAAAGKVAREDDDHAGVRLSPVGRHKGALLDHVRDEAGRRVLVGPVRVAQ